MFSRSTKPIVNYILIGINILFFLYEIKMVGFSMLTSNGADSQQLFNLGGMQTIAYQHGQYWRVFTSMFLHANLTHIVGNMASLIFVGNVLENLIGHTKYLIVYFLSGIGSNYLSLLFLNPNVVSVGASGAVFGIVGCLLIVTVWHFKNWTNGVTLSLIYTIGINLGVSVVDPSINLWAHLGGLIAGILCGVVISAGYFIRQLIRHF